MTWEANLEAWARTAAGAVEGTLPVTAAEFKELLAPLPLRLHPRTYVVTGDDARSRIINTVTDATKEPISVETERAINALVAHASSRTRTPAWGHW